MALTMAETDRIVQATIAKAQELNIKVSVAVCDAGSRLLAFRRMDGAIWASTFGSRGKAAASAAYGRPSGDINADSPIAKGIVADEGGPMLPGAQGAVPIIRNGVVEGSCGVGGGTSQQDEDCASAGAAAL